MGVVVLGQVGRDLVLRSEQLPKAGGTAPVRERIERLGGKGANQAVGLTQLNVPVSLVGMVGADGQGAAVLREAVDDGIDVAHVGRRGRTALLVTLLLDGASRRLLEDVPRSALLTVDDVDRAAAAIDDADTVSIQLQQPDDAVLAAARRARRAGARVVADGAVKPQTADELLPLVDVWRADAEEAGILAGRPVRNTGEALAFANRLLDAGPGLVALAIPEAGDLLVWPGGHRHFGLAEVPVVDRTGAGDAFVAGLIAALRQGASPDCAGELASAAAASTVTHLGGRPNLASLRLGRAQPR
jgi:ribokinase